MKIKLNKIILTLGALALTSCQASFKDYGLLNNNSKVITSVQNHQKFLNSSSCLLYTSPSPRDRG